jgi:hypothetical protein
MVIKKEVGSGTGETTGAKADVVAREMWGYFVPALRLNTISGKL